MRTKPGVQTGKKQYRKGDQIWVRERNLAIISNYLWEAGGPTTRAFLAQLSGLNRSTVGSLLFELQSWGLVKATGITNEQPGRPGILVDINPNAGRVIGAEIGVGSISVVLSDMKANVLWRRQTETTEEGKPLTEATQAEVLFRTECFVREAEQEATDCRYRLFGIGLSVPGLVDYHTGTLLFAPNLGWHDVPLRDLWQQRFSVPVIVENEANASALAEQMFGAAKQVDNFVYLSAGVGLGGGFVVDGKLYGGMGGFAGEIGHMTLEPDGPQCNCGNRGCWEMLIGPRAILQRVREAAAEGRAPILFAICNGKPENIRLDQVLQAAALNEPAVLSALDEIGRYLGIGIANLVNSMNPKMIVLGGVLSLVGTYIVPRAQQEVNARALAATCKGVEIKLSNFTSNAAVMGGIALIIRQLLNNPTAWCARREGTRSEDHLTSLIGAPVH